MTLLENQISTTPLEYQIPKNTHVVVVADMFAQDYPTGGAELTTKSIIEILESFEYRVFRLHSISLTEEIVESNKDKIWVICNWADALIDGITALVRHGVKYYCVEYDYKYCFKRSSHLHELQESKPCDCERQKLGRFVEAFYLRSQHTFFMSDGQRQEYFRLFPRMKAKETHFSVLSSVWSEDDLSRFVELSKTPKKDKWVVLSGGTWIKNQQETESYCRDNNLEYELIGGLPYEEFTRKLAEYKGLVFHPKGFDTAPRIVIEAKLLGLQVDLNENVQHKDEDWFCSGDNEKVFNYLKGASQRLMEKIKI